MTDEEMEANEWLPEEQKAKQIGSDQYKLTTWPGYGRIAEITQDVWGKGAHRRMDVRSPPADGIQRHHDG